MGGLPRGTSTSYQEATRRSGPAALAIAVGALRPTFAATINRVDNTPIFRHHRLGARSAAGPPKESVNASMVSTDILVLLMDRADSPAGLA
jgi:hypothetical protein